MNEVQAKKVFWNTLWVAFMVIFLVEVILASPTAWLLSRMFDLQSLNLDGNVGGLGLPNLMIASILARNRCRKLGLSKDCTVVETFFNAHDNSFIPAQQSVEVWYPKSKWIRTSIPLLFGFFCIGALHWIVYSPLQRGHMLFGIAGLLLFVPGMILSVLSVKVPDARVDAHGISGTYGLWRRSILWSQVSTCEIVIIRDVFGQVGCIYPVFKDVNGKVLMSLDSLTLAKMPAAERDRFLDFIKTRLQGSAEDQQVTP